MESETFESEIEKEYIEKQKEICSKHQVEYTPSLFNQIIGVALQTFDKKLLPIHGLRHLIEFNHSTNWYIWAGEYSEDEEFFKPIHVHHLLKLYPDTIKYLGLPPGWRFLTDGVYDDVWFDEKLLIS